VSAVGRRLQVHRNKQSQNKHSHKPPHPSDKATSSRTPQHAIVFYEILKVSSKNFAKKKNRHAIVFCTICITLVPCIYYTNAYWHCHRRRPACPSAYLCVRVCVCVCVFPSLYTYLRYAQVSKETYMYGGRGLLTSAFLRYASIGRSLFPYNRSLLTHTHTSDMRKRQKRPVYMSN
jgi:hypothetical protein